MSAFNCNCLAEWCCFNILYRFLCNTLTPRQPRARINSDERILLLLKANLVLMMHEEIFKHRHFTVRFL